MNGVIFIAGVYGVGKSTLGQRMSQLVNLPFYSASDLISREVEEIYGTNKKVRDKEYNQKVLIECVNRKMKEEPVIMLAGHFCILGNDNRPERLPSYVYKELNIRSIVLLEAESYEIINNLQKRDNREYSKELIEDLILLERDCAKKMSEDLRIPLKTYVMSFSDADVKNIVKFIKEVYGEDFIRY